MKTRARYLLSLITIACLIIGFTLAYFLTRQPAKTTSTENNTPVSTVVVPEKITLKLPGASPIDARVEDYSLPSSLWVVVNKDYPLSDQQYIPADLTLITTVPTRPDKTSDERSMRQIVLPSLESMFTDAKTAGFDLMIGSGFRSYTTQAMYFNNYVKASGEAAANLYSAKPGQSEHQTGLSLDIALTTKECYLDTCFGTTTAGKWLAEHSIDYGFILRYPSDKTAVTKYQYEPWHFRYVGTDLAKALHDSKLTLDEAYPYLQTTLEELRNQKKI